MDGRFGAVLLAAGNSTRMGTGRPKVLEELGGKPVVCWSLEALSACRFIGGICLVCRREDMEAVRRLVKGMDVLLVPGGKERQDSVRNGVLALGGGYPFLLIHDGARPLVSPETLDAVCRDALAYGAAAAAVPSKDTCKIASREGFVESTPDRSRLMAVQTPQAFRRELYVEALRAAEAAGAVYTDDCQLVEAAGGRVKLTMGDYKNFKITTQEDLISARALAGLPDGKRKEGRYAYRYRVRRAQAR